MSNILERVRKHGGIRAVHMVPVTATDLDDPYNYRTLRHAGWQNVVVCYDGTRFGLSMEDEAALKGAD